MNVSWDYTFPELTRLSLSGYDFAPKPLAAFLSRHPKVEMLYDAFDSVGGEDSNTILLKPDELPKLKALKQTGRLNLAQYFDDSAQRQLQHLAVGISFADGHIFSELVKLSRAKTELRVLELGGTVLNWREEEDSSSEEEELPWPRLATQLKECITEFEGLQELGISLESDSINYRRPDGKFGSPDPATVEDLVSSSPSKNISVAICLS